MIIDWQTILSISGIILTIFFGILSYVFYRKGIKKKKLLITSNSTILISEDLSNYNGLKISYNNEEVKTLTSTSITIRNIGNDVIEDTDITPSDPIIITTTNKFLSTDSDEYQVISSNKKVSTSLQKINDSKLQLSFDFLNPKNELSVTLLHNGDIFIDGDLKNGSVDKVSSNDKYVPTSKSIYSEHNDIDEFSYSKLINLVLCLLTMMSSLIVMMIITYQLIMGYSISNISDYLVYLFVPIFFIILFQKTK